MFENGQEGPRSHLLFYSIGSRRNWNDLRQGAAEAADGVDDAYQHNGVHLALYVHTLGTPVLLVAVGAIADIQPRLWVLRPQSQRQKTSVTSPNRNLAVTPYLNGKSSDLLVVLAKAPSRGRFSSAGPSDAATTQGSWVGYVGSGENSAGYHFLYSVPKSPVNGASSIPRGRVTSFQHPLRMARGQQEYSGDIRLVQEITVPLIPRYRTEEKCLITWTNGTMEDQTPGVKYGPPGVSAHNVKGQR
ncbi:hypothetical protein EDB83DRAFT_2318244 [Lactarius deliciosus]|nr:hypothetical protein EDB83DRAFT_2318244 [Lactarius deliciosus]